MKLKINKLTIEGFKCFEKETVISFNEITKILLGHNGCGKTSIIEAIRFVLTGEFPVDGINYLTEKAFVKADFDTMSIARLKSFGKTTVYLNDSQVTNKELDAVVETTFGLPKQSLKICTSSEVLANLSSADLGNFLKTYIPEEMTEDILFSYIKDITSDEKDEIRKNLPPAGTAFGINLLNALYTKYYEERTVANRTLKGLKTAAEAFTGSKPKRTIEEIDTHINEINSAIAVKRNADGLMQNYLKVTERAIQIKQEIEELKKKCARDTSTPVHPDAIKHLREEISHIDTILVEKNTSLNTIKRNIEMFKKSLDNLNKPVCPLSKNIICTTDKTSAKDELVKVISDNEKLLTTINIEIAETQKKKVSMMDMLNGLIKDNEAYQNKVRMLQIIEDKKKNIPVIPEKPVIPTVIANADEILKALRKERDEVYKYNQYLENVKKYEEYLKYTSLIDNIVNYFSPKGKVMEAIMAHYTSLFEDTINEKAELFKTGMKFMFSAENGIRYLVRTSENSSFQSYDSLSNGEKIVVMFLMLDLINCLTGLRIMLLDDLNHLDTENLKKLVELIKVVSENNEYDHIILACVDIPEFRSILENLN